MKHPEVCFRAVNEVILGVIAAVAIYLEDHLQPSISKSALSNDEADA